MSYVESVGGGVAWGSDLALAQHHLLRTDAHLFPIEESHSEKEFRERGAVSRREEGAPTTEEVIYGGNGQCSFLCGLVMVSG